MNIVFASSDLYSKLAVITIKTLLMNNEDAESIDIYYIGDKITEENQSNLKSLVNEYQRNIEFISLPTDFENLTGSNRNGQTVFSYCFFQDILPQDVDKVLLLEPDAIVTGSLKEFYEMDISDCYIAAADDLQSKWYKRKLGMKDESPYVNCGVVIYNLKKWREDNMTEKMINLLVSGEHMFFYDVQDVINYAVEGYVKLLPPKFNCTTSVFLFDYKNMIRYRHPSSCCTRADFEDGKKKPVVVHFTKNQVIQSRPWVEGCDHPFSEYYTKVKTQTTMRDEPSWEYHPRNLNKIANFLYKKVSKTLTASILGVVHSFMYPVFMYRVLFRDR